MDPADLRSGALIDLTTAPVSPAGTALVDALVPLVIAAETRGNKRGAAGLAKLRDAVGAVVGSLLHHWVGNRARPAFHPRQRETFSGGPVGHRQFIAAIDALADLGMVHTAESKQFLTDYGFAAVSTGYAARYWPSARLLELAEACGVTAGTARKDFEAIAAAVSAAPPPVPEPLQLRALKPQRRRGQATPLPRPLLIRSGDAVAAALADGVRTANSFAGGFTICNAELFEDAAHLNPDPEMVALAKQLIQRQAGRYDPSDLKDRYEARLRDMIEAKLKGEGVELEEVEAPERSNVVDLMALLKKSLGQAPGDAAPAKAAAAKQTKAKEPVRNQPGLKLPIKCGKTAGKAAPQPVEAPAKPSRKRA